MSEMIKKYLHEILHKPISGSRPKGGVSLEGDIPSFGGENITMSGEINFYPVKKITTEFFESMKRGRLKNLDVLINKDGANSGKSSIYRKSPYLKAVVNEHLFILRGLKDKLDQEYLHYLIQSSSVKKILETKITGSAQPGLNSTFVQNFPVEIPPFPEQKKIASILTSVDDVIEKTQSQINKLQDLKKGMINKFLTKGIDHKEFKDSELGMIPRSWELIPLSQIANKKDPFSFAGGPFGSNLKTEHYCDSGIRIIQLQNIGDGEFLDNYEIFTSKEKANELLSCNIFPDDIIISKMGDPVARACIIPNLETRYLMASDGIRLSVNKNEFDVNFILETINHHRFRSEAERISIGSTRKRISLTELRTLIIAHPSLKEQKEISSFIHSINLSIKKKKQKLFKVQCLKKSLMQDLLTGKVRVSIN